MAISDYYTPGYATRLWNEAMRQKARGGMRSLRGKKLTAGTLSGGTRKPPTRTVYDPITFQPEIVDSWTGRRLRDDSGDSVFDLLAEMDTPREAAMRAEKRQGGSSSSPTAHK